MAKSRKQQNRSWLWMVILGGGLIVVAALLLILAANQENGGEATVEETDTDPIAAVERISLEDAKAAFDNRAAVFLDVRTDVEYEQARIPGAVLIPLNQIASRLSELDPAARIITYCTWPAEESSARAALILQENGFEDVKPILGGFAAWVGSGYPVEPWCSTDPLGVSVVGWLPAGHGNS